MTAGQGWYRAESAIEELCSIVWHSGIGLNPPRPIEMSNNMISDFNKNKQTNKKKKKKNSFWWASSCSSHSTELLLSAVGCVCMNAQVLINRMCESFELILHVLSLHSRHNSEDVSHRWNLSLVYTKHNSAAVLVVAHTPCSLPLQLCQTCHCDLMSLFTLCLFLLTCVSVPFKAH